MQNYLSWWDVDRERAALVNDGTRQQVRFVGRAADAPELRISSTRHRFWMRFDYEDPECRYPLLIQWQNEPRAGTQRWRVDHVRSAGLWRRETGSSSGNPSYGLWRRVDDAITDALTCWPAMDAIGPSPRGICINGGWHNGAWVAEFYRWFQAASSVDAGRLGSHLGTPLVPLAEPAPSAWEFVRQSIAPQSVITSLAKGLGKRKSVTESIEQILARSDLEVLPSRTFCGTHFRSHDDRRAIFPVGFLSRQSDEKDRVVRLRLLYVDDDLICDCLSVESLRPRGGAGDTAIWKIEFHSRVSRLCNGGVLHRREGLTAQLLPHPTGADGLGPAVPRSALWRRLTTAMIDAVPGWQATTLTLPQEYLKDSFPIDVPACEQVGMLRASGSPRALPTGFAKTNLKERLERSPNVITFESAFDEEPDGATASVRASEADRGWWRIEAEPKRIRNMSSGQCLSLAPADEIKGWGEQNWRFTYSDREIEYPVFVRRTFATSRSGGTTATLEIDHAESARLWKEDLNRHDDILPYGWWRRIDESVVDALCFWKELGGLTQNIQIHSVGGWFNGSWNVTWRRVFGGARFDREGPLAAVAQPILEPLNTVAPPAWNFVEHAKDVIRADLAHVQRASGLMPNLPPHAPLEGFQGQTSYLIRADGKAVLFPAFAGRRWTNSSYPDFTNYYVGVGYFTYANEEMFLTCPYDAERDSFSTTLAVEPGIRVESSKVLQMPMDRPKWALGGAENYAVWLRTAFDLLQAWPNWRGSACRLLEDPAKFEDFRNSNDPNAARLPKWEKSGILLAAPNRVAVGGGFAGGRYTPYFSMSSDTTKPV